MWRGILVDWQLSCFRSSPMLLLLCLKLSWIEVQAFEQHLKLTQYHPIFSSIANKGSKRLFQRGNSFGKRIHSKQGEKLALADLFCNQLNIVGNGRHHMTLNRAGSATQLMSEPP